MTCNAHKESCHKLSLILVREQGLCIIKTDILVREQALYVIKTDCSRKMVVAFIIKKKLFNGQPILPIAAAAFLFIFVVLIS